LSVIAAARETTWMHKFLSDLLQALHPTPLRF